MIAMDEEFVPCQLVAHGEEKYSLLFTEFDEFVDYIESQGGQGGGYSWEAMIKAVAQLREIDLSDLIIDPEGSMFAAVASNRQSLLKIVSIIRELSSDPELMNLAITTARAGNYWE